MNARTNLAITNTVVASYKLVVNVYSGLSNCVASDKLQQRELAGKNTRKMRLTSALDGSNTTATQGDERAI